MRTPWPDDRKPSGKLAWRIVRREALDSPTRQRMWELLERYYLGVTPRAFARDLDAKTHVLLVIDRGDGSVQGFCTLISHDRRTKGRSWRVVFTGDTIIEPAYWGQQALHRGMFAYLMLQYLRARGRPVYWLLTTKGYKTYLLMTRNFPEHWPRHDRPTAPWIERALDEVCADLFEEAWRPELGIVREDLTQPRLRPEIAPTAEVPRTAHPDIDYFLAANPGWPDGDQLACLARFDTHQWLHFALRTLRKSLAGLRPRRSSAR